MNLCGSDQDHKRLVTRIKRIEGQVRGLGKMVEEDRECMEV
ncbi:MAG: metal-sensitive transcriptional regulator, partial [Planctomycetota bacterium]